MAWFQLNIGYRWGIHTHTQVGYKYKNYRQIMSKKLKKKSLIYLKNLEIEIIP